MGQYEKALQDADVAISLAPDWPKGYFRRGRALAGLKVIVISIADYTRTLKKVVMACASNLLEGDRIGQLQE